ncbi:MAG: NAD-dependent epimerase/dehydratase family protein [Chloroflexota bacterium]
MASVKTGGLVLVTGGAGFIGCNLVAHYLSLGATVRVLDNLSRPGSERNLAWLETLGSRRLEIAIGDVRDWDETRRVAADADVIFHLASQVAVTTSVADPRHDFEVNALGTINVLEAARDSGRRPTVLVSSTNKVYGGMETAGVELGPEGYRYRDLPHGVSEEWPLDFHSPYGCSKGAADQYARDYARIYGLPTVVFRQSCIYGPHQFGNEDQGWVAHFALSALAGRPITIFGDGYQVRDVLYVDDLVAAFRLAVETIHSTRGKVYNVGGGPANAISLRWLTRLLSEELHRPNQLSFADWRPGDQRVYVSDIRRVGSDLGWRPRVDARSGVVQLVRWLRENLLRDSAGVPSG